MCRNMSRKAAIAALLIVFSSALAGAADNNGVLQGVVKDSAGKPLPGAYVKLKNDERRLTFMVISQAQGRYTADKLPAGKYVVQGVGNGAQSEWSAPVAVAEGKSAKLDLSLTAKQAPALAPAWPSRMPEEDPSVQALPEGDGKALVASHCAFCHGINEVTTTRGDSASWENILEEMRGNIRGLKLKDLTDEEAKTVLNYVVTNFPPLPKPDPNSRLPRTTMKVANYRVVQYELENTKAETHDIAVAPDGIGWSNQRAGGNLSRFDPVTYEYSEMAPPVSKVKQDRKSTRLNSSHIQKSRMPSSA